VCPLVRRRTAHRVNCAEDGVTVDLSTLTSTSTQRVEEKATMNLRAKRDRAMSLLIVSVYGSLYTLL